MRIPFEASSSASEALCLIGRTEDVKLSPSNNYLAVLAYKRNAVYVFALSYRPFAELHLYGVTEIHSKYIESPHGIAFIDDHTIIVCNREGPVSVFSIPASEGHYADLAPVAILNPGDIIKSPGSVAMIKQDDDLYHAWICNNYSNTLSRHAIYQDGGRWHLSSGVRALADYLSIPDGVAVSRDGQWIAVSNHGTSSVLIYENSAELSPRSAPCAILRCVYYPHGLRFTADNSFLLVADAGAPYVHIYRRPGTLWRGGLKPLTSFRVMTVRDYLRGRRNAAEGGPKGLDINATSTLLVTTSERQPLAFFDLPAILKRVPLPGSSEAGLTDNETASLTDYLEDGYSFDRDKFEFNYELAMQRRLAESDAPGPAAYPEKSKR